MEVAIGIFSSDVPNVERDMEIQSVRAIALNLHIFGIRAERLHCTSEIKRNFHLLRAHENNYFKAMPLKQFEVFRLHIFEVDQYIVGFQSVFPASLLMA